MPVPLPRIRAEDNRLKCNDIYFKNTSVSLSSYFKRKLFLITMKINMKIRNMIITLQFENKFQIGDRGDAQDITVFCI